MGELYTSMSTLNVPEDLIPPLIRYLTERRDPGGFLKAVLCNNLVLALQYENSAMTMQGLKDLVFWIHNKAPSFAWGSARSVETWIKGKEEMTNNVEA